MDRAFLGEGWVKFMELVWLLVGFGFMLALEFLVLFVFSSPFCPGPKK